MIVVAVEIAGDMAHRAVGVEIVAVEAGDAGRFLAAVLQRVEAERDQRRGALRAGHAEDAALLAQLVVVEWVAWSAWWPSAGRRRRDGAYRRVIRLCRVVARMTRRVGGLSVREGDSDMAKDHGPSIKDDKLYEDLRSDGASKEKAARIANAKAAGTLDHKSTQAGGSDQGRADEGGRARSGSRAGRRWTRPNW